MEQEQKLNALKGRNEALKPIVFKSFATDAALDAYEKEHQEIFDEYFENLEVIDALEWQLMTPQERAIKEEHQRLSALKRQGKLL